MSRAPGALSAACAVALACGGAGATWSILIADTRTGEIAVGSATCVQNIDLRAETPVLLTGIGAATGQSAVDSSGQNRGLIRDSLLNGVDPAQIVGSLLPAFDTGHSNRQYGMLDVRGGVATYSGPLNGAWAGGVTGRIERGRPGEADDIIYAIQGNVLTGEPVVLAAEQALRAADGDLAARLMAAMEAARVFGGDGRCSCRPNDADACGSPPPSFTKTADVGYMLVARDGDRDRCRPIVRLAAVPSALASVGTELGTDLLVASAASPVIERLGVEVITELDGFGLVRTFTEHQPVLDLSGSGVLGVTHMAVGDVTGDGLDDLAVSAAVSTGGFDVRVYPGLLPGVFDLAHVGADIALAAAPADLELAQIDGSGGLEIVLARLAQGVTAVSDAGGPTLVSTPIAAGAAGAAQALAAADLDADSDTDLLVLDTAAGVVRALHNDGAGGFAAGATSAAMTNPVDLAAADMNADGVPDAVVLDAQPRHVVVFDGATGVKTTTTLAFTPGRLRVGDFTGDGAADVAATANQFVLLARTSTPGVLVPGNSLLLGGTAGQILLDDLTGDGRPDLVSTAGNATASWLTVAVGLPQGDLDLSNGCAAGDYFLTLNEAFKRRTDPDPVLLLNQSYQAWNDARDGRPDAIESVVTRPGYLVIDQPAEVLVDLRDHEGLLVTTAPTLSALPVDEGRVDVLSVEDLGDGLFRVVLDGLVPGFAQVRFRADDGGRPVYLMPRTRLLVLARPADLTGDGVVDSGDLEAFIFAFLAQDLAADVTGDGVIDSGDLEAFIVAFLGA
jgi:hypothetical protein